MKITLAEKAEDQNDKANEEVNITEEFEIIPATEETKESCV